MREISKTKECIELQEKLFDDDYEFIKNKIKVDSKILEKKCNYDSLLIDIIENKCKRISGICEVNAKKRDFVEYLLKKGININEIINGETILDYALIPYQKEIVDLLLKYGAKRKCELLNIPCDNITDKY